jgi:hypothetical protein
MEIKITDYLQQHEIKEIVSDELRIQIREHFRNEENARRLLSNLAYQIVSEEVEKIVPNYEKELVEKVVSLLNDKKSVNYRLFEFDYNTGNAKSLGARIVENTVRENQQLIKDKVVDIIQNADYSEEALIKFESLAEEFTSNIYSFVELMRSKK